MKIVNSTEDQLNTGFVIVDVGDGVKVRLPVWDGSAP